MARCTWKVAERGGTCYYILKKMCMNLNITLSEHCCAIYKMFVDEAGLLSGFFLIFISNKIRFCFLFLGLSILWLLYIHFFFLLHFHLLSTIFFPSSAKPDVVKVHAVSDDCISVLSEDKLDASQNLLLSATGGYKVSFKLLNLTQLYYEEIYLKLDQIVNSERPRLRCERRSRGAWPSRCAGRDTTMDGLCWQCCSVWSRTGMPHQRSVNLIRLRTKSSWSLDLSPLRWVAAIGTMRCRCCRRKDVIPGEKALSTWISSCAETLLRSYKINLSSFTRGLAHRQPSWEKRRCLWRRGRDCACKGLEKVWGYGKPWEGGNGPGETTEKAFCGSFCGTF